MTMRKYSFTVTTIADGSATVFSPRVRGLVHSVIYTKHPTLNYTDGVDFTITSEDSGESLWTDTNINASETVRPTLLSSAGGTGIATATEVHVAVVGRIKVVIAAGGDSKVGTFTVLIQG